MQFNIFRKASFIEILMDAKKRIKSNFIDVSYSKSPDKCRTNQDNLEIPDLENFNFTYQKVIHSHACCRAMQCNLT